MRHYETGEEQTVPFDTAPEKISKLMVQGYQQVPEKELAKRAKKDAVAPVVAEGSPAIPAAEVKK